MNAPRPCGECTLCCRLIGIDKCDDGGPTTFPFEKPADTNCKHCRPGHGCEIFGTELLPRLCKTYSCLWKDPQVLPEGWRPDKVNAVCHAEGSIHGRFVIRVIVDRYKPVGESFSRWVDVCVADGMVFVIQSGDRIAVVSDSAELSKAIENTVKRSTTT
jgi:hypothetical protein